MLFIPSSTVYGGITNLAPTRLKKVRHRVKTPSGRGNTTPAVLSAVFVGCLREDPPPNPVETEAFSEVELQGEGERGKGTCPVKFAPPTALGCVDPTNSSGICGIPALEESYKNRSREWDGILESSRTSADRMPPVTVVAEGYNSGSIPSTRALRPMLLKEELTEETTTTEDLIVVYPFEKRGGVVQKGVQGRDGRGEADTVAYISRPSHNPMAVVVVNERSFGFGKDCRLVIKRAKECWPRGKPKGSRNVSDLFDLPAPSCRTFYPPTFAQAGFGDLGQGQHSVSGNYSAF